MIWRFSVTGFESKSLWRGLLRALPVVALSAAALHGEAADLRSILFLPKQRIQTADFRATGHLVRVDPGGTRTSFNVSIKGHAFPGVVRLLVEIAAPRAGADALVRARSQTHILLEMRPNGQNSIEIAHPGDKTPASLPFEKWNDGLEGTGYSYEDLLEPQYFWPAQAVVKEAKIGARDCDVLKSEPGEADRTHYGEVLSWLDRAIGFPVHVEKKLKGTGTVKEFNYMGIRRVSGVWTASQVETKIRGKAGSTLLILERGSAKAKLGAADFSPEQMTHF